MQTTQQNISLKQTLFRVLLLIAFCYNPLFAKSLNNYFIKFACDSKLNFICWIAIKVEKDDYYVHEILHVQFALIDLNKAFLKDSSCSIYNDKIRKSVFGKSYKYSILFVRQLLKNKDPPERDVPKYQ